MWLIHRITLRDRPLKVKAGLIVTVINTSYNRLCSYALLNEHRLIKVCRCHDNDLRGKAARRRQRNPAHMRSIIFLKFPLTCLRLTEVKQKIQGKVSGTPLFFSAKPGPALKTLPVVVTRSCNGRARAQNCNGRCRTVHRTVCS